MRALALALLALFLASAFAALAAYPQLLQALGELRRAVEHSLGLGEQGWGVYGGLARTVLELCRRAEHLVESYAEVAVKAAENPGELEEALKELEELQGELERLKEKVDSLLKGFSSSSREFSNLEELKHRIEEVYEDLEELKKALEAAALRASAKSRGSGNLTTPSP